MQDRLLNMSPEGGWRKTGDTRLAPLTDGEMNWFQRRLTRYLVQRHQVPAHNLFATFLHAPRIFLAWLPFASQLMPYGSLTRRQTELVILRVAWRTRCRYEWVQHVQIGRAAGLSDEDILRVTDTPGGMGWTSLEAALLQAVDDVVDTGIVGSATWTSLASALSKRKLTEAVMLIGHYCMLASVIDSLGVEVE